jgi:hypothetical protein
MSKKELTPEERMTEAAKRLKEISSKKSTDSSPKKKNNTGRNAGFLVAAAALVFGGYSALNGDDQDFAPVVAPEPPPIEEVYNGFDSIEQYDALQELDQLNEVLRALGLDTYDTSDDELFGGLESNTLDGNTTYEITNYDVPPLFDSSLMDTYNSYSGPYGDFTTYEFDSGFGVHNNMYGPYGPYGPYKYHPIPR